MATNQEHRFLEGEHLEAVYTHGGELKSRYLRGVVVDEIVNGYHHHSADPNDWTNYTFHHDHLNTVTALTGHNGIVEESIRYDAFGAPLTPITTDNRLTYTGRDYDPGTGLYEERGQVLHFAQERGQRAG